MVAQDAPAGAKLAGVPAYDHRRWLRASREAEELRRAHDALGEITGAMTADELLGEIFGRFCMGK